MTAAGPAPGRTRFVHVSLMYAAYYAASGFHQPYFPLWLKHNDLTEGQIAIVLSLPIALRIVMVPGLGWLADRLGAPARMLRALTIAFVLFALGLGRMHEFWPILALTGLMMVVWQGTSPLLDATALNLVRRGIAADYGRLRLWGSISFIGASIAGGFVLGWGGPDMVFLAFTVSAACVALSAIGVSRSTDRAAPANSAAFGSPTRGAFLGTLVAAALIQASHMAFNGFGSLYLRANGYADETIGLLWGVAAMSEIGMFWAGPQIARRLSPQGLLMVAAAFAVLRWAMFAQAWGIAMLVVLQVTQAATFSGTYLGLMRYIATSVSERRAASAQSSYMTILSILSAGATLGFGKLYQMYSGGVFLGAAVLPALSLLILVTLRAGAPTSHASREN